MVLVDSDIESIYEFIRNDFVKREAKTALIFCNTRDYAELVASLFKERHHFKVEVHHGSLSKIAREKVEVLLREGLLDFVICTSSLELGIDIGNVDLVYQIDSPRQVTKLIQRVGRSAHTITGTARGTVICTSYDDYLESLA